MKLDTDIHNSDSMFSISLWSMWAQVCNNLWFIPGHSKMKIWQNAFNLYFDKTSLSELQEDTTTTNDNFTFGQHSNAFKKYLKRTYSVNYESTSVRTACSPAVGWSVPVLHNNAIFLLRFCSFVFWTFFLLIYKDIDIFCKEDLDPKMLRIMTSSHKLGLWP